ncbi:MAG: VCBS repeat-containing protein [Planctomycetes bacterium]|nr:VCBS repeat-containing protein [Planctomycetota bacterium]
MGRLSCVRCDVRYDCPSLAPGHVYRCGLCRAVLYEAGAAAGAPPVEVELHAPGAVPTTPTVRQETAATAPAPAPAAAPATPLPPIASPPTTTPLLAQPSDAPASLQPPPPLVPLFRDGRPPEAPPAGAASGNRLSDASLTVTPPEGPLPPLRLPAASPLQTLRAEDDGSERTEIVTHMPKVIPRSTVLPLGSFGRYELLEEVGRGGMGAVYKARQVEIGRTVALKILLSGVLADERELLRFRREAAAAAALSHPGIVQVHDFGVEDGRHYMTMEFIEGKSLHRLLADTGPLHPPEALRLVRLVSEAVHHAHTRGIVHRDLKPDNVILRPDGRPVVTDFGLAKPVSDAERVTASGAVLGTLAYMSPEQAAGEQDAVGPLSDVYSLGAILYQLLTGRTPFSGQGTMQILGSILSEDPPAPRTLRPGLARDIETLCLKAMAKEPTRRYASAQAFADDIARYLAGESISARPTTAIEQTVRKLRKHRVASTSAAAALAAILLLLVVLRALPGRVAVTLRGEDPQAPGQLLAGLALPGAHFEVAPDGLAGPFRPGDVLSLAAGQHTIRVAAPGYLDAARTIDVRPGADVGVPLDLFLAKGTVLLHLTHDLPEPPSPEVTFRSAEGRVLRSGSGQERVVLPVGAYVLDIAGDGFFPVRAVRLRIERDAETHVTADLKAIERWRYPWPMAELRNPVIVRLDGKTTGPATTILGDAFGFVHFVSPGGKAVRTPIHVDGACEGAPAFADADGDGVGDLVVGTRMRKPMVSGLVTCLSGAQGFKPSWRHAAGSPVGATPAIGDVDGDGKAEVLYQGERPRGTVVCLSGKDGSVRWQFPSGKDAGFPAGAGCVLADVDGDGIAEVLASDDTGTCVTLDGRDGRVRRQWSGKLKSSSAGLWAGDLDGKPPLEVVLEGCDARGGTGLACLSAADGSPRWFVPLRDAVVGRPVAADLDGDGRPEIVVALAEGDVLAIAGADVEADAGGRKGGDVLWQARPAGRVEAGPAAADLDGDGKAEVLLVTLDARLTVLSGTGAVLWTAKGDGEGAVTPAVGDLEGNGAVDVLAVFSKEKALRCLSATRRLLWKKKLMDEPRCFEAADVDGDGIQDVWAFVAHDKLYCLSGRDGAELWSFPYAHFRPAFALADLAGDGRPCAVFGKGRLCAVRGEPGLAAVKRVAWDESLPRGSGGQSPAVGDLDGDGRPDVVSGDTAGGLRAFSGNDRRLLWTTPAGTDAVEQAPVLADVNGDGVPDACYATTRGRAGALDGRDGRPLWPAVELGDGRPAAVAVGDWNRDGTPDLVVTASNRRTVFLSGKDGQPLRPAYEPGPDTASILGLPPGAPVLRDLDGDGVLDAVLSPGGAILCVVNGASGAARDVPLPGTIVRGAAVVPAGGGFDTQLVVGCADSRLYSFSRDGRMLGWFAADDALQTAPFVRDLDGDGVPELLFSAKDRVVYCLAARVADASRARK